MPELLRLHRASEPLMLTFQHVYLLPGIRSMTAESADLHDASD
jgi:hypothetical protein